MSIPPRGHKGRFIVPSDKTLPFLDTRIAATRPIVTAAQSGLDVGRGLVRMDKNNFAPRIGLAFRLDSKSVMRGGYGFYYPTSAAQGIRDPIATNPFNQGITKRSTDPSESPLQGMAGRYPRHQPADRRHGRAGFGGLPAINAVPVGLQQPRIQQYNATYEREIMRDTSVRFSYLGSVLSGLIAGVDLNEIAPSNTPFGTTTGDGITACTPGDDCDLFSPLIWRVNHSRPGRFSAQLWQLRSWPFQCFPDASGAPLLARLAVQLFLYISGPEIDRSGYRQLQPGRNRLQPVRT